MGKSALCPALAQCLVQTHPQAAAVCPAQLYGQTAAVPNLTLWRHASPCTGPAGAALLARQLLHNALPGLHASPSLSTAPRPAETARIVMWRWPCLEVVGQRLA